MKRILALVGLLTAANLSAQVVVTNLPHAGGQPILVLTGNDISNIVASIDESTNLFSPAEVEVRLGGVYSQQTGDAGTLIAIEKWDLFVPNLGIGLESISSAQKQAAEFIYVGYRKVLGNTAGSLFLGMGYDELNKAPMAVVGGRLEHRFNKHLGGWTSVGYGVETKSSNDRGMVVGAGVSYSF